MKQASMKQGANFWSATTCRRFRRDLPIKLRLSLRHTESGNRLSHSKFAPCPFPDCSWPRFAVLLNVARRSRSTSSSL